MRRLFISVGLVLSFLIPFRCNEDFILFDAYGFEYLTLLLFSIPFGSLYHAKTFIPG